LWPTDASTDAPLERSARREFDAKKVERARQYEHKLALDGAAEVSADWTRSLGEKVVATYSRADGAEASIRESVGGLYVEGYASTFGMDRDGDRIARDAFRGSLEEYLTLNPVVLLDHDQSHPLGLVQDADVDDVGLAVKAFIPKPERGEESWKLTAYNDIKRGLRRALSIGGTFVRSLEPLRRIIRVSPLTEISFVTQPSNDLSVVGRETSRPSLPPGGPGPVPS
jgi:HK97 family phage prohead protease